MRNKVKIVFAAVFALTLLSGVWAANKPSDISPVLQNGDALQTKGVANASRTGTKGMTAGEKDPADAREAADIESAYQIPWRSVNGGGNPGTSASYMLNASLGQSTIGFATGATRRAGIGYWYGTNASASPLCDCPFQSDFDEDGFLTALDLGEMIDILFAGHLDVQDPNCPTPRADFDCDGFSTALDLGGLIDHLFAGSGGPCDPCTP